MSDGAAGGVRRRRLLRAAAASGVATALAGCSGGGSDNQQTGSTGGDGEGSDGGDDSTTSSADSTSAAEATASGKSDEGGTSTTGDDDDGGLSKDSDDSTTQDELTGDSGLVTATVRLSVRDAKSNVDEFEMLRTTFERFELTASDGTTVTLDDEPRDVDLTEVGEGGTVELFETEIPAGAYEEGRLYLPIQDAALADGSDPEFEDAVPASRSVRGDAIDIGGDEAIGFDVRLGLVRVAGDGPWTYSLGWGVGPD